ncbi:hypothetical protein EYB53_013065 [Candidatus Chloroploca sp. M-50]|uniref:Glycosyltransferase RgtA/B/C/D-like domain-containing protein n=1 Tax=Candidatus Chloroploca mongolica TaxID=2528176 RepID=A0ABS4DB17_9CHLR|nr:DUF2298 domain-containing protein [Candidatus Chloroploca mongolica]MBP1466639.1 hypothetical protein [Candidatus Chloroploca mongolica]
MRRWKILWLLLLPPLAALLLWQYQGTTVVRPASLHSFDQLAGFEPVERNATGAYRWSGPEARLSLPVRATQRSALTLRGAVAPGATIALSVGAMPLVTLVTDEGEPELRHYHLLTPLPADHLGWVDLHLRAEPPAVVEGRQIGLALFEVEVRPFDPAIRLPPGFAWLTLSILPLLIALGLAGLGLTRAVTIASAAGVALVFVWALRPELTVSFLRDLQAFLDPLVLRWWLALQLVGLTGLPLTMLALRSLPLAGYPLAKILGLLLVTLVAWVGALAGLAPFEVPLVIGALLVVALVGIGAWIIAQRRGLDWPRLNWQAIVGWELLLLVGLFAGCMFRWHGSVGPALTGTEKPMEVMIINALLRYDQIPPASPWFAGYPFNYYYLGYVAIGALALLTGTPGAYAFNLGFAVVVALIVVGVAYLAVALVRLTQRARRPVGQIEALAVGLLALIFVIPLGSQASAIQLAVGTQSWWVLDIDQLGEALQQRLAGAETITLSRPTVRGWQEPAQSELTVDPWPSFDWFRPSRVIFDEMPLPEGGVERRQAITEFPAFTFYLGDLHPHTLALPIALLGLGLALALVAGGAQPLTAAVAGIVVSALYCINSWDAPTYALLFGGAMILGAWRTSEREHWPRLLIAACCFGIAASLTIAPFLLTFTAPAGSVLDESFADLPIIGRLATMLAWSHHRSRLLGFLVMFGLFLVPIIAAALRGPGDTQPRVGQDQAAQARPTYVPDWLVRGAIWGGVITLVVGLVIGFPLLFLLPLIVLLTLRAWQAQSAGLSVAFWAAAVGGVALFVPEVVYIEDHLQTIMSRQNMIFKFYYQVWLIWGIIAAYAVWWLIAQIGLERQQIHDKTKARHPVWHTWLRRSSHLAWILPLIILLAGASIYPIGLARWTEPVLPGERTFDGMAFLGKTAPDELGAIRWLEANVGLEERMVNGFCNCEYERLNRASALSGVQSVLGWLVGHERLWRSGLAEQVAVMNERQRDVPAIYAATTLETALELLQKHDISYIYVSPLEREFHGTQGEQLFAEHFELVFSQGDFQIYRGKDER